MTNIEEPKDKKLGNLSLEEDVNLAIKERWEPIGSLVWSYSPASNPYGNYVQTMIKN